MRHRAFAIGACHMYASKRAMRILKNVVEGNTRVESCLICRCADALKSRVLTIKKVDCFVVIHNNSLKNEQSRNCRQNDDENGVNFGEIYYAKRCYANRYGFE